jgi:hypothetical protein
MLKIAAIFYSIPGRNWQRRLMILPETINKAVAGVVQRLRVLRRCPSRVKR